MVFFVALACASCTHDSSKPPSAASASSSSAPTSTTVLTPEEAKLQALLLTADQLGVTFTSAQLDAPTDTVQPCGQPDPRSVVHPAARVVALLADYLDGIGVAENLSSFASTDDAGRVMGLLRAGVGCGQGTITGSNGPATVAISGVQDVTAQTDADEAFAVVVTLDDGSQVTTLAARVDQNVVVFQMGSKKSGGLDPLQIAKQGVDKIRQR